MSRNNYNRASFSNNKSNPWSNNNNSGTKYNQPRSQSLFSKNEQPININDIISKMQIPPINGGTDLSIKYDEVYASTKCAYAVLLMLGDSFLPGVLATCYSILKYDNTGYDIVVMVTTNEKDKTANYNVSEECINIIKKLNNFGKNRIVIARIPYISIVTNINTISPQARENYGSWFYIAYTKWNILQLIQYDKVLLLDADAILLNNVDLLFQYDAPAAPFMYPNFLEYNCLSKNPCKFKLDLQYLIKGDDKITGFDGTYADREKMTLDIMRTKLTTQHQFVFVASTILLQPNQEYFKEYVNRLLTEPLDRIDSINNITCNSMFDEKSLAKYYTDKDIQFTIIHQRFNAYTDKAALLSGDLPQINHYVSSKPWGDTVTYRDKRSGCIVTENIYEYDDIKCWYKLVEDSLKSNILVVDDYLFHIKKNANDAMNKKFAERINNVRSLSKIGYVNRTSNAYFNLTGSFSYEGIAPLAQRPETYNKFEDLNLKNSNKNIDTSNGKREADVSGGSASSNERRTNRVKKSTRTKSKTKSAKSRSRTPKSKNTRTKSKTKRTKSKSKSKQKNEPINLVNY